jgi:hypothetical protein
MKSDSYIELLKWGREQSGNITHITLQKKIKELGLPSESDGMQGTFNTFTRDLFHLINGKYIMSYDAYFQLYEHERLEEARIESKRATKIATWSLWITIAVGIAGIIIGIIK